MIPISSFVQNWGLELPAWVLALAITLIGWLAALLLRIVFAQGFRLLQFDRLSSKTGVIDFLRKGQVAFTPSELIGIAVFWVVVLATLLQAAFVLDTALVVELLASVGTFLPGVVAALLVVVVGWAVVSFVSNFTLTLARNASWPQAGLLAKAVRTLGLLLVIALAAEQVGLHLAVFSSLFLIVAGGLTLGLALAFGLGCQDLAREAMKRFLTRLKEQDAPRDGPDLEG